MDKIVQKSIRKRLLLGAVAQTMKANIIHLLREEELNKISKGKMSNRVLCQMFSYVFHYHKAVAVMT